MTATETRTAPPDVVDAVLQALQDVKWPDGEPYIHMAETHMRKLAEAAAVAALEVAFTDLRDRCQRAVDTFDEMIDEGDYPSDADRKAAKRDGVKLALSYIDETIRGLQ